MKILMISAAMAAQTPLGFETVPVACFTQEEFQKHLYETYLRGAAQMCIAGGGVFKVTETGLLCELPEPPAEEQ